MKKNLLALLLIVGVVFSSCKKEDPVTPTDARDKFVGTWNGTQTIVISGLGINSSDAVSETHAKSSTNANQIIIDGSLIANVNGNSYTYNQFTETITDPTLGTVVFIFNGTGTINGTNIVETGTVSTIVQGQSYNGTWSTNLVKQ